MSSQRKGTSLIFPINVFEEEDRIKAQQADEENYYDKLDILKTQDNISMRKDTQKIHTQINWHS